MRRPPGPAHSPEASWRMLTHSDLAEYPNVIVGEGTVVEPGAQVGVPPRGAQPGELPNVIGDRCSVGTYAVLEPGNRVGDDTRIHSHCFLEYVTLGRRVFLGPGVVFTDDPHPVCPSFKQCVLGATVYDDVAIGGNATILPGVKIGAGSLVGAGSVVTRDVPPGVVVAGSPAKFMRNIEELTCFAGLYERPYIWRTPKEDT